MICPWCERPIDVDTVDQCDIFRERYDIAARLGRKAWAIANEYADSFRPAEKGWLTPKKRIRILREVLQLWETCLYEYDGKRFRTDQQKIVLALTAVCNAQKAGFANHNYLKRVLSETAVRVSAEGMSAAEEAKREEDRREAARTRQETLFSGDGEVLSADEFKRRKGIGSLVEGIGRKI